MQFFSTLIFAMALSSDGFGVGISYGIRKIKIPLSSLLVISITSALAISLSMLAGHLISSFISMAAAEKIGAVILILVGIWIILQSWFQKRHQDRGAPGADSGQKPLAGAGDPTGRQAVEKPNELVKLHIKPMGMVVQILKEPSVADLDSSGTINGIEAFFLGLALAMDALGAGFGAAMAGFKPLLTPLVVGAVKFIFVSAGDYLGRRYAPGWLGAKAALLPGVVLIILGIMKVY